MVPEVAREDLGGVRFAVVHETGSAKGRLDVQLPRLEPGRRPHEPVQG